MGSGWGDRNRRWQGRPDRWQEHVSGVLTAWRERCSSQQSQDRSDNDQADDHRPAASRDSWVLRAQDGEATPHAPDISCEDDELAARVEEPTAPSIRRGRPHSRPRSLGLPRVQRGRDGIRQLALRLV